MQVKQVQSGRSVWEVTTVAGLIALAVAPVLTMLLDRAFVPMGMLFTLSALVLAGLALTRNRWLTVVVAVAATVLLAGAIRSPFVLYRLSNPAAVGYLAVALLQLVGSALAAVTGLVTLVQGFGARQAHAADVGRP